MSKEPMQLDSPQEPKEQPQAQESDFTELIEELKRLGATTPEQVAGMARASSEAGNLANMLGESRRQVQMVAQQNQELRRMLQDMQASRQQEYSDQPVDVKKLVRDALREEYSELTATQRAAQAEFYRQIGSIKSDEDYHLVSSAFDQHMSNPNVQAAIHDGQTSIRDEYNKLVRGYYRRIASQAKDAIETLGKKGASVPGATAPPFVEGGQSGQYAPPESRPDSREQLRELRKQSRGTDDDIDKMLRVLLPDGDPILRPRGR